VLLGAEALGLGACFFGQFEHEPAVRSAFGVPAGFRAVGTIAVGHPSPEGDRRSLSARRGRRSDDETVHWGTW
jgi:nitroreductase